MVEKLSFLLSIATILAQAALLVGLAYIALKGFNSKGARLLKKHGLLLAWLVALGATAGSLYYSKIAGFEPCELCWYQRIFIYPQVIILGLALWKKEKNVADLVLILSVIGGGIALYQTAIQFGLVPSLVCSASAVSCSKIFVRDFGYVTIPVMALTGFIMNIVFMASQKLKIE